MVAYKGAKRKTNTNKTAINKNKNFFKIRADTVERKDRLHFLYNTSVRDKGIIILCILIIYNQ